jgi:hypothetical protein
MVCFTMSQLRWIPTCMTTIGKSEFTWLWNTTVYCCCYANAFHFVTAAQNRCDFGIDIRRACSSIPLHSKWDLICLWFWWTDEVAPIGMKFTLSEGNNNAY